MNTQMSRLMRKPTICIGENKNADQLLGNPEADQRLCFRYKGSIIPLLKFEISSFWPASSTVQAGLCRTCSETTLLVFPRGGSNYVGLMGQGDKSEISRRDSVVEYSEAGQHTCTRVDRS